LFLSPSHSSVFLLSSPSFTSSSLS
jgi:hypothetical protein